MNIQPPDDSMNASSDHPWLFPSIDLIAAERRRQVASERWNHRHDDGWSKGELARAAAVYALPDEIRELFVWGNTRLHERLWPWERRWFKPTSRPTITSEGEPDKRIRELVKAGALICAEIDRLSRTRNG